MPLYRTLCISAHYNDFAHIKGLITQSATLILENGGVVRAIENMGMRTLPQRMHRHKAWHYHGDYWAMSFDASPQLASQLAQRLRTDPRVVRWTTRKLGVALPSISPRSPHTPAGSPQGQTVRLYPLNPRRYDVDVASSSGAGGGGTGGGAALAVNRVQLGDDEGNVPDEGEDLSLTTLMAPQQREAYQEARRKATLSGGRADSLPGDGRRNFSTTTSTPSHHFVPLNRSQARLETRWLEKQHPL